MTTKQTIEDFVETHRADEEASAAEVIEHANAFFLAAKAAGLESQIEEAWQRDASELTGMTAMFDTGPAQSAKQIARAERQISEAPGEDFELQAPIDYGEVRFPPSYREFLSTSGQVTSLVGYSAFVTVPLAEDGAEHGALKYHADMYNWELESCGAIEDELEGDPGFTTEQLENGRFIKVAMNDPSAGGYQNMYIMDLATRNDAGECPIYFIDDYDITYEYKEVLWGFGAVLRHAFTRIQTQLLDEGS